ncbi:MAG: SUMF1/EgtB/PvdO family nonheme iron enzyme, partial [Thermoguttaceae bacterium]|nr:SUMF1/EgtB/PvdO family nonheme iron enzyme [Thermoguttaceae bacterium]
NFEESILTLLPPEDVNYDSKQFEDLHDGYLFGKYKNYRLKAKLGEGGMGQTWLAEELVENEVSQRVVLKILTRELRGNEDALKEVRRVFDLTKNLNHSSICPLLGRYVDPNFGDFLVMKYADGGTLADWFNAQPGHENGLPLETLLPIFRPLAEALDLAHRNGILHRDVKPQNIMFMGKTPVLIDFGIAARIRPENVTSNTQSFSRTDTMAHSSSGTPQYMAPEQMEGSRQNARTDQYALAMVLYEMLNGSLPFSGNIMGIYAQKSRFTPKLPFQPAHVSTAFTRALSADWNARFMTCSEFMTALTTPARPKFLFWSVALLLIAALLAGLMCFGKNGTIPDEPPIQPTEVFLMEEQLREAEAARLKAEADAEASRKAEADALAKAEKEAQAKVEAEKKAQAEAEAKQKALEAQKQAEAKAEKEAQAKAEAEKRAKAETEAKQKALEAQKAAEAKAAQEAREKSEAEKRAKEEAEARQKALEAQKTAEAKAEQEAQEKAEAEKRAKEAEEAKILAESKPEFSEPAPVLEQVSPGRTAGERMVKTVDGIEYAFRWCPAGSFTMGSTKNDDEKPHSVTLTKGYWMLETEVTQGMWKSLKVQKRDSSSFTGDDLPVETVSWHECREFCKALSSKLNMKVDLPTEAQWEYACRAGTTGAYAGDLDAMAWYYSNSGSKTHPVGQKKANEWGLYDMHGNVWEWCLDVYEEDFYVRSPSSDPCNWKDENSGSDRVFRGGGWSTYAGSCRSARRYYYVPGLRDYYLGFRIVLAESDK